MSGDELAPEDPKSRGPDPWSLAMRAGLHTEGVAAGAAAGTGSRYRLGAEIGRGGLAIVYRGHDADLGREVAVKVLKPELCTRSDVLRRFVEEARVGAQLQHPGVVPVHEMGLLPEGQPFLVMKLVEGRTLADLLDAEGGTSLPVKRRLAVFETLAQTLAYAHARGVVHRDVKPSNVMLGAFGEVQLLDWGLAKVMARPGEPPVAADPIGPQVGTGSLLGTVIGTPGYMPPEQARGDAAATSPASDVFALGSLLCRLLTGKPAFVGETEDVLARTRAGDLAGATARLAASDADPELTDLARRCLSPDPAARPQNAGEVAGVVERHLARAEERAEEARLAAARAEVEAAAERRRRRLVVALVSLAAVAVVGATVAWVFVERGRSTRAERTRQAVEAAEHESSEHATEGRLVLASASARRALALAEGPDGTEALRTRTRARVEETERRETASREAEERERRDRALATAVEDAQLGTLEHEDPKRLLETFADAFRRDGLDVATATDDAVVAHLRGRGVTVQAATALDDWARLLSGAPAERLIALADRLDPDPLRLELRRSGDRARLETLAAGDPAALTPVTAERLVKRLQLLSAGDAALPLARRAVELWPADVPLVIRVAAIQEMRRPRNVAEELRWATTAAALRPRSPAVWTWVGDALRNLGPDRREEADQAYRRAVELDPTGGSLLEWADFLTDVGRFDDALEALRRSEALGPANLRGRVRAQRAITLQALGRLPEALAEAEAAVVEAPDAALAHHVLGALKANVEADFAAADLHFETAIRLAPSSTFARYIRGLRATAARANGDASGALATLQALLAEAPNDDWLLYAASRCEQDLGRPEVALELIRRAHALNPAFPRYLQHEGEVLTVLGRFEEARAILEQARQAAPGDHTTALAYARTWLRTRDYARAEELARPLAEAQPSSLEAQLLLGAALDGLGRHAESAQHMAAALALKPDDPDILRNLAVQLMEAGDPAGALAAISRGIERAPRDAELRVVRATRMAIATGRTAALADLHEAVRLDPTSAEARRYLGMQLTATGELVESERAFREGRARPEEETTPDQRTLLRFRHARVLAMLGRHAEAYDALRELLESAPRETAARKDAAAVLIELGDLAAARREVEETRRREPSEASVRAELDRLAARLDALDLARRALLGGDSSASADAAALLAEADYLRTQGAFAAAASRYATAFAADPALEEAHRFDALRAASRALAASDAPAPPDLKAVLVAWLDDEIEARAPIVRTATDETRWIARRALARIPAHADLLPLAAEEVQARLGPASRARLVKALAEARDALEASAPR